MAAYNVDTWLTPITIDSTNNVIVVTEDPSGSPTVITITIDAGTYYLHDDSSFHATKKGLLYTIKTLLNDGTTAGLGTVTGSSANTYSWSAQTPTTSTGLANNGLRLTAASTATVWEVTWTGATTLDAHLFGSILSSPIVDDTSSNSGGDQVFTWPHATKHRMVTRDLGDGHAVDKRRVPYKDVRWSSQRPSDSVAVVWDEGYFRIMRYEDVPGVEVYEERASEAEWAGTTGRGTGDTKAVWFDVWDALSVGGDVIIVHDSASDLQVDTHDYEVVRLWEVTPWDQFAQQQQLSGDYYTIEVAVWASPSASSYSH